MSPTLDSVVLAPGSGRRRRLLIGLATFFVPLFVLHNDHRYLGSGDTGPAELLPISILEHGGMTFDEFVSPGFPLPYYFRSIRGQVLSSYSILPGLMNVPVYAVARLAGVPLYANRFRLSGVTAALLVSFSVFLMYRCLLRVCARERDALLFTFAYFFGTCAWTVAGKGLFQHGPSVLLLALALLLLLRDRPFSTAGAGAALGFAVINRPTNLLIAIPLAIFVLRHRRSRAGLAGFVCFAAVPALVHAAYAWHYFGTPFTSAQPVSAGRFSGDPVAGLAGLLMSPSRGLLVISPFLLFCIPAAVAAFRRGEPPLFRYLVVACLLEIWLYSFWDNWWGGHSFGYRLLTELVPLLVLVLASQWSELRRIPAAAPLFSILLLLSVCVQILGASTYPSRFNSNIDLESWRLWDVTDSELGHEIRKALHKKEEAGEQTPAPGPVWWTGSADDPSIQGFLEWPRDGGIVRHDLVIKGWAGSGDGEVEVQAVLNPGQQTIPVNRFGRQDVCTVLPSLRDCSLIGFVATLPAARTSLREYALVIEIRDPRRHVRRIGPVYFYWHGQAER
jgi:hypothetical protein